MNCILTMFLVLAQNYNFRHYRFQKTPYLKKLCLQCHYICKDLLLNVYKENKVNAHDNELIMN